MDVEEALAIADALIFAKTDKHLSTLQAVIFRGSWSGQKYEQIAQECYCSDAHIKMMGAELWDLLSQGLEERVSKKTFRAALERKARDFVTSTPKTTVATVEAQPLSTPNLTYTTSTSVAGQTASARVFICHCNHDCALDLAEEFEQALNTAGHTTFMAGESMRDNANWSMRLDEELKRCDALLLLLSREAAISEVVTEVVRRAKAVQENRPNQKPTIIPVRVDFPPDVHLTYDLRGYLNQLQQYEWHSPADTPILLHKVLYQLAQAPVAPSDDFSTAVPTTPPTPEKLDRPPLPSAEPELPEGQVELASVFYVERPPIEACCYETILKPGSLIRIKAPRQMGKTSLMARILHHASQQGCCTVPLSFQLADGRILQDLDLFLRWFCANVGRGLQLPNKLGDYWDEIFGSKISCKDYFENYLLAKLSSPLVLGLDEVDRVFQYPELADDFFGLLRAWHEEAKNSEVWKQFRLVVVHSTEVYIPLNINQSPFNVGLPIELPEFTPEQVKDLAYRHGLDWSGVEVDNLMAMVGGHPYLIRVALYYIARQELTLEHLLQLAPTEAGPYSDHLRRHLWNLEQQSDLADAFKTVVAASAPVRLESLQMFKLYSTGLVHLQGNEVTPRCELYRRYFRDRIQ